MLTYFYDIESVNNVFTLANWRTQDNLLELYILLDEPVSVIGQNDFSGIVAQTIKDRVWEKNKNFTGEIKIFDLRDLYSNSRLAKIFGLSSAQRINDPSHTSVYPTDFRLVCDTDKGYTPDVHPYLLGYNSQNFDTTLLAEYFYTVWPLSYQCATHAQNNAETMTPTVSFQPTKASIMRKVDDEMFSDTFNKNMPLYLAREYDYSRGCYKPADYTGIRWKIRKNMLMSGRHIDVARLNEKQKHVGLKRIIGMLGGQILESDKLRPSEEDKTIENLDQLADLLAYNASDVINLDLVVFRNKTYQANFALKKSLLQTYPELIYRQKPNEYAPDIRPEAVRNDRLYIDSSSAQLATKTLCPYGHLTDIPVVSFLYPSEQKAKELGVPRRNILEECNQFFHRLFTQPEPLEAWNRIYQYYKSIEGKNYNASENYAADYPNGEPVHVLAEMPKDNLCIYYYDKDGNPTSCFAAFSTGGIHGAEYNKAKYEYDLAKWQEQYDLLCKVQALYPNPVDLKMARTVTIDGTEYPASKFLKSNSTMKNAAYRDLTDKKPKLFVVDTKGNWSLNTSASGYAYTSVDPTNHEDFTSYYPNLLRMMSAFYNEGLGYDRYAEIFQNKQDYGFLMKEKNANLTPEQSQKYQRLRESAAQNIAGLVIDPMHVSKQERDAYDILRDGTKLILNSASGAADANFESNIRMNNQIISMRIIGQLFSWRIAQAQTYKGAKITSTNTDGLYSVLEAEENAKILKQESDDIGVEIEPEPIFLISKDTNNRLELKIGTMEITSASGGTVGCRKGPVPTKALSHPAIIDWALSEYLVRLATGQHGLSMADPFSQKLGMEILEESKTVFEKQEWLRMFQNIIAASPGSMSYNFAIPATVSVNDDDEIVPAGTLQEEDIIVMQHYNRVFIMQDGTEHACHLYKAAAHALSPLVQKKRALNNEKAQQHDPIARRVLTANGVKVDTLPKNKEAVVSKVTNIEPTWYMYIQNAALNQLSDAEMTFLMDNIDLNKYLGLLCNAYTNSWKNTVPGHTDVIYEDEPVTESSEPVVQTVQEMPLPSGMTFTQELEQLDTPEHHIKAELKKLQVLAQSQNLQHLADRLSELIDL